MVIDSPKFDLRVRTSRNEDILLRGVYLIRGLEKGIMLHSEPEDTDLDEYDISCGEGLCFDLITWDRSIELEVIDDEERADGIS